MNSNESLTQAELTKDDLVVNWAMVFVGLAAVAYHFREAIASAWARAENRHNRGERLLAYRQRHSWKKSDLSNLKTLDLNAAAQKKLEKLDGKGRPVVKAHVPLGQAIVEKVESVLPLFSPDATVWERKRALKQWPYWKHHVEALVRGETALARLQNIPGPVDHAERCVGSALGISSATVHAICGEIRAERKRWDGAANHEPMTLAEFEDWMRTGEMPGQN